MKTTTYIILLIVLLPFKAQASEGLLIASMYYCNAMMLNDSVAEECISKYPHLKDKADDALTSWRSRNEVDARSFEKQCKDAMKGKDNKDDPAKRAEFKKYLNEMIENMKKTIKDGNEDECLEFIANLYDVQKDYKSINNQDK